MYTVVVANEKLNNTFLSSIDFERCGFKLLGIGETFLDGIKLVEEYNPDVLIADFEDGSEVVINDARKKKPFLEIVFFTERRDFITAKRAIYLNALEYIVKPCSETYFEDTLFLVRRKLDKKSSRAETYKDYLVTSLSVNRIPDNIKDAINIYKLNLRGEDFILINIQNKKPEQVKTAAFFDAVRNSFGKFLNGECLVFNDIVTLVIADEPAKIKKNLNVMLISIIQSLEKIRDVKFVIGISNSFSSLDKMPKAYSEARDSLLYSFEDKNEITLFGDIRQEGLDPAFLEDFKSGLENKIRFESIQDVQNYISGVFSDLKSKKVSLADFYICMFEIISVCNGFGSDLNLKTLFLESIINGRQLDFVQNKIIERCCKICNDFISKRQSGIERIVDQAMLLIEENYKNADLSLKILSEKLHISINYLCAIMKKIKGTSFVNLLTAVRMEKSKDLLINTNSRIQEVAYEVGFTDQHYFSYCFRKHFNTTPKEVRETKGESIKLG